MADKKVLFSFICRKCLLLAVPLFWGLSADAYEVFPEFRSITEEAQQKIERPDLGDGEYQSDILTYMPSLSDYATFVAADNAFNLSVGSVSSKHFNEISRLKIKTPLGQRGEFRLTHFEQSDFDQEDWHTILELIYWQNKKWGVSVYGEPSYSKAEDDMGVAILHRPQGNQEWRFFYTMVDFSRNNRNDESDKFLEKPFSTGLVGRWWQEATNEFSQIALRFEGLTHWRFPDDLIDYRYMKRFGGLKGRWKAPRHRYINYDFSYMRQQEELSPLTGNVIDTYENWLYERVEALMQWDEVPVRNNAKMLLGLQFVDRKWDGNLGLVRHRDVLPHVWFKKVRGHHEYGVGYEFTWHRALGPDSLRSETDEDTDINHRLNTSVQWNFSNQTQLKLLFTFDLDRFGTGDTWEGGNGQFIHVF